MKATYIEICLENHKNGKFVQYKLVYGGCTFPPIKRKKTYNCDCNISYKHVHKRSLPNKKPIIDHINKIITIFHGDRESLLLLYFSSFKIYYYSRTSKMRKDITIG